MSHIKNLTTRPDKLSDPVYVVTTVFNPIRFNSRWRLYNKFAHHVAASGGVLYTAEVALGDRDFAVTTPQVNIAEALPQILLVQDFDIGQVGLERSHQGIRQQGQPVFLALAIPHGNLPVFKIEVFHPQADAFHQAQASAIQEVGHESVAPFQMGQHGAHLGGGEDDRQPGGTFGPFHVVQPTDVLLEHFLVQEQDGAQGLVLGGGGDIAFHSQVGQELLDFPLAHLLGVSLAVEQDVALDPVHIGLLGANAVVFQPDFFANLVEQPRLDSHNPLYFNGLVAT